MSEQVISAEKQSCPSEIQLSSWFDGDGETHIGQHLEECSECRGVVEFYRKLSMVLSQDLQPRKELLQRVLVACQEPETGAVKDVMPFWTHFMRVAAAIALIAGISGAVILLQNDGQDTTAGKVIASDTDNHDGTTDSVDAGSSTDQAIVKSNPVWDPGNLVLTPNQLQLASSSGAGQNLGRLFLKPFDSLHLSPSVLPNSVRHVWVVDDVDKCQKYLAQNLPVGTALCAAKDDHAICFQVVLSDQQLQALVNRLEQNGWALVTPSLPQPGEQDRLMLTGKEVLYVVDLVAR